MADEYLEKLDVLRESVESSEQDLRSAVGDLATAAQNQLDIGERIAQSPWPWIIGGFVLGLWFGTRR